MLTADMMNNRPNYTNRYQVEVVCGPQTGPEGSLIDETRSRGVPLTIMPELVREISPGQRFCRNAQADQHDASRAV